MKVNMSDFTKFKRKIYFKKTDFYEAKNILKKVLKNKNILKNLKTEIVKTEDSIGRITASAVYARISVPPFSSSAMDGIAVKAEDIKFVTPKNPKLLKRGVDFEYVNTGFKLPEKFNAVIMIENVNIVSDNEVIVEKSVPFFSNIRAIGEDVREGEMIIPTFTRISPETASLLYSAGVFEVNVLKKPRAIVFPTGSEIVERGRELEEGMVYETNSIFIKSYLERFGFSVDVKKPIPDIKDKLEEKINVFVKNCDVLFILSGTSSGEKDYSPAIIEKVGKIHFHGINYIPGKPFCFGEVEDIPVFCIPGYPGAALGVIKDLIKDSSYYFTLYDDSKAKISAISAFKIPLKLSMREFLKVRVGKIKGEFYFYPLKRGSSVLKPYIEMDGILETETYEEGINENEVKKINIIKSIERIEKNIIFIGSNDFLIDELRDLLKIKDFEIDLSIIHTGSLGGIFAIREGKTHIAGIHLLDEKTGEYNKSYVKKYIKGKKVVLFKLARRKQGFIVRKGNPKKIKSIEDLTRDDISFINRQRGSGTRILLDYLLKDKNIPYNKINGYDREVFTHLESGIAVKKGEVDCSIAIYPTAKLLELDFVEIGEEDYHLLMDYEFFLSRKFSVIEEILKSEEFKRRAKRLGGYALEETGKFEIFEL